MVIPLERPTKTSFLRNSFQFCFLWLSSIVILLHHIFSPVFFFFKRNLPYSWLHDVWCMKARFFPVSSIWLKFHSLFQRLDAVISLLLSSESFPAPPYSLALLQNGYVCAIAPLSWSLPCNGSVWLSSLSAFWSCKITVGLNIILFFMMGTSQAYLCSENQ